MPQRRSNLRRDQVADLLATQTRALHAREIASRLEVREGDYLELLALLDELAFDGLVRALPGQRFRAARSAPAEKREGFLSVNPKGFAFLSTPGESQDVFVPAQAVAGAMHGDRVRIRVVGRTSRGLEGAVEEILERRHLRVAGLLRRRGRSTWLEPDDNRVRGPIVLPTASAGTDGDVTVVAITRYPSTPDENPEGEVVEVLGDPGEPDVETRKVLLREQVEEGFDDAVQAEIAGLAGKGEAIDGVGREDLRELALVTVDPDDARDHDDAIWVGRDEAGWRVCVAIADVARYVTEGSALDGAAVRRAFSIYLPDRAVPMLPAELSSNLCSLVEGKDRACLAVHLLLDEAGSVRECRVTEAVMRSRAKLTYTQVAAALGWTAPGDSAKVDPSLIEPLACAARLAKLLHRRRLARGALELSVPEARIVLDPQSGAPIDVVRRASDPGVKRAYNLIEELMLAANEAIAGWLIERGRQPVYRVHPPPDEAKLERLAALCEELGIEFAVDDALDPKRLSEFLERVAEHPLAEVVGTLALRSLKQASYDLANVGHFGLALAKYLHFTSPIRRYPDLLVHRAVKRALHEVAEPASAEALRESIERANLRERRIMEVEREIAELYRAIFMRSRIGMEAEGRVVEVFPTTVIVSLDEPFVEVRVPEEGLGRDSYEMTDDGLRLIGQRSGESISLGDRMLIRVEEVSLARRVILGRRIYPSARRSKGEGKPRRGGSNRDRGARNPAKTKSKRS